MELAIRMAIIESASHRVGRLPLILDDALDGFHGQTLDHLVRVLIEFARDGQQILLMTSETEVAQRVRVHHGWVAQLREPTAAETKDETIAYRQAATVSPAPYVRPLLQPAAYTEFSPNLHEINAQLASWPVTIFRFVRSPLMFPPIGHRSMLHPFFCTVNRSFGRQVFLGRRSSIEDAPGMSYSQGGPTPLAERLRALGIHLVGQFLEADPRWIADHVGLSDVTPETVAPVKQKLG